MIDKSQTEDENHSDNSSASADDANALDPANALPFQSNDDQEDKISTHVADLYLRDINRIRRMQEYAGIFTVVVVFVMFLIICLFLINGVPVKLGDDNNHLFTHFSSCSTCEKTEFEPSNTKICTNKDPAIIISESNKNADPLLNISKPHGQPLTTKGCKAHLSDLFSEVLKISATTLVTIITVLSIAITLLTVGITRAIFSLAPQIHNKSSIYAYGDDSHKIMPPTIEMFREIFNSLSYIANKWKSK